MLCRDICLFFSHSPRYVLRYVDPNTSRYRIATVHTHTAHNTAHSCAPKSPKHTTVGTELYEWYPAPHSKWFKGKITRMPTAAKPTYQLTYEDKQKLEYEEREVRNWIDVRQFPEWQTAINAVKAAYTYLENRITGNCQTPYHCSGPY